MEEMADRLLDAYVKDAEDCGEEALVKFPVGDVHKWWREVGNKRHNEVGQVARACLSLVGTSGNLERDFCLAGQLIEKKRTQLDSGRAEMILLCNARKIIDELAPDQIDILPEDNIENYFPTYYSDPDMLKELELIDFVDDDEEELLEEEEGGVGEEEEEGNNRPWTSLEALMDGEEEECVDGSFFL